RAKTPSLHARAGQGRHARAHRGARSRARLAGDARRKEEVMTLPAAGEGAFSSDDASLEIDDRASSRVPFQRLSQSRVCAVLNCLTEATFFYRADDPDLFDYLRRHRGEFERFFEQFFAWDLYVDRKVA